MCNVVLSKKNDAQLTKDIKSKALSYLERKYSDPEVNRILTSLHLLTKADTEDERGEVIELLTEQVAEIVRQEEIRDETQEENQEIENNFS